MHPAPNERSRARFLTVLVLGFTLLMLSSLVWGFFNPFFFSSDGRTAQGIDFFSTPKAFLNLLDGRSMYDSWGGQRYGPYSTWYVMHPAFTVAVASYLSLLSPWTSYWVFTFIALAILAASAHLVSSLTADGFEKRMAYVFFFCSFVTYWLLYVGNMHSITVLSLTLILAGMYDLSYGETPNTEVAVARVAGGLLLSLFTKPVLLLALPVLLINRATRRASLRCLGVYAVVTLGFLLVPLLNPESIGLRKMIELALDPGFVTRNLDVYTRGFVVNDDMKDNIIHWLNIVAQSGTYRNHIDIFSLSAFVNSALGMNLPGAVYKAPLAMVLLLSAGLFFVRDERERLRASLLVLMASSFSYFLSYNTVWEYQYSSLFPSLAVLFLMHRRGHVQGRAGIAILALGAFYYLPSPYVLVRGQAMTVADMNWIRSTKVVPALISFGLLARIVVDRVWRAWVSGWGKRRGGEWRTLLSPVLPLAKHKPRIDEAGAENSEASARRSRLAEKIAAWTAAGKRGATGVAGNHSMDAAAGWSRRLLPLIAALALAPSTAWGAQAADVTPAYIARGRQTEARLGAYHDRIERFYRALSDKLRIAAPELLPTLAAPPPAVHGYQILAKVVADAAPPSPGATAGVVRYSWGWSDTLIAREMATLDRLEVDLVQAPPGAGRARYEKLAADYRAVIARRRPIDSDIQYNWLWQAHIDRDRPLFDHLQTIQDAVLERQAIEAAVASHDDARLRTAAAERGLDSTADAESLRAALGLRAQSIAREIAAATVRVAPPDFAGIERPARGPGPAHPYTNITVPIYTDITDEVFVEAFRNAVEALWRARVGNDEFRLRLAIEPISPERLYCGPASAVTEAAKPCAPPAKGAAVDLKAHVARFPKGGAVLTTGAPTLQLVAGRAIVLGPHDTTPHVLAHEFGHVLGFPDTYRRGYRNLGADGYQITELADHGDIMGAPGIGPVLYRHFEELVAAMEGG